MERREFLRDLTQLRAAPHVSSTEFAACEGCAHLGHDLPDLLLPPVEPLLGPLKLAREPLLRLRAGGGGAPIPDFVVVFEPLADGARRGAPQARRDGVPEPDALHGEVQTGDVGLQRADARQVRPEVFAGAAAVFPGEGCGGERPEREAREGVEERFGRRRGGGCDGVGRLGRCGG